MFAFQNINEHAGEKKNGTVLANISSNLVEAAEIMFCFTCRFILSFSFFL